MREARKPPQKGKKERDRKSKAGKTRDGPTGRKGRRREGRENTAREWQPLLYSESRKTLESVVKCPKVSPKTFQEEKKENKQKEGEMFSFESHFRGIVQNTRKSSRNLYTQVIRKDIKFNKGDKDSCVVWTLQIVWY